jgi:predicted translin family RNA/ssDNA-binding protein
MDDYNAEQIVTAVQNLRTALNGHPKLKEIEEAYLEYLEADLNLFMANNETICRREYDMLRFRMLRAMITFYDTI